MLVKYLLNVGKMMERWYFIGKLMKMLMEMLVGMLVQC